MEQRVTVKRLADWYGVTPKTAGKYIRQMTPHMENPLTATMQAFHEWEAKRTVSPIEIRRQTKTQNYTGRMIVPRER